MSRPCSKSLNINHNLLALHTLLLQIPSHCCHCRCESRGLLSAATQTECQLVMFAFLQSHQIVGLGLHCLKLVLMNGCSHQCLTFASHNPCTAWFDALDDILDDDRVNQLARRLCRQFGQSRGFKYWLLLVRRSRTLEGEGEPNGRIWSMRTPLNLTTRLLPLQISARSLWARQPVLRTCLKTPPGLCDSICIYQLQVHTLNRFWGLVCSQFSSQGIGLSRLCPQVLVGKEFSFWPC